MRERVRRQPIPPQPAWRAQAGVDTEQSFRPDGKTYGTNLQTLSWTQL